MAPAYSEGVYRMVGKWTDTTRVEFVPDAKRPGTKSYERYQAYSKACCVGQALQLGAKPEDLIHDYAKKYLIMARDQRIRPPQGVCSEAEKAILRNFQKRMRGPAGCNLKKLQAKTRKAEEKLKKMGINLKDMHSEKNCQETNDLQALRLAADCLAGEILTEVEAAGRKITDKDVMRVLELWAFRKNDARLNVLPKGKTWVNSDTLGLIRDRKGNYIMTSPTKDYPNFMTVLNRYLSDRRPPELGCDFPFTTISLNYGYAAKRHRDSGNLGPSMIKAFGKFKGGSLCYWPDDDKNISVENLREEDKVVLDIGQGLALFDGNRAHEVEPFQGERFSLVFFSVDKYWKASDEILDALRERGYAIPTEETMNMARSLLPAPRGYSNCQSLTSMFGMRESPKVFQWFDGQEADSSKEAAAVPVKPVAKSQKATQEIPKSADLKAMFFGVPAAATGTASSSSASPSDASSAASTAGGSAAPEDAPAPMETEQPQETQESPKPEVKNANLKAMLFGEKPTDGEKTEEKASEEKASEEKASEEKASVEKASEEKASGERPEASQQEPSTPAATPPRKESVKGCKRPLLASGKKAKKSKKAKKEQDAKARAEAPAPPAAPAGAPAEEGPGAEALASPEFCPGEAARGEAWCGRLSLLARALRAAEAHPEAPTVALSNGFRAILHASEEPLADLSHALELLLSPASEPLPEEAVAAARALAAEGPAEPLGLAAAAEEWRAARAGGAEAPARAARLLRASGSLADGPEAAALSQLLLGRPSLQRQLVLRALAHAFVLTRPGAAGGVRGFASAEGRQATLLAMEKALTLAYGEAGGNLDRLLRPLLQGRQPAELYGACGPRCGEALLPMKPQETRDLEVLLAELTGSAVLVEQLYPGERVQVHKMADGSITMFGPKQEVIVDGLGEALLTALRGALQVRECVVEAVLQRSEGALQVFDCLWLDGRSLVRQSLGQRRAALERALRPCDAVQLPPSEEFALEEPPTEEVLGSLLEEAGSCGCRGVVLKRLEREYEAGCSSSACVALLRKEA